MVFGYTNKIRLLSWNGSNWTELYIFIGVNFDYYTFFVYTVLYYIIFFIYRLRSTESHMGAVGLFLIMFFVFFIFCFIIIQLFV